MTSYHRTNINLLEEDCRWLRAKHGYGWTEAVRRIIHEHVQQAKERKRSHEQLIHSAQLEIAPDFDGDDL